MLGFLGQKLEEVALGHLVQDSGVGLLPFDFEVEMLYSTLPPFEVEVELLRVPFFFGRGRGRVVAIIATAFVSSMLFFFHCSCLFSFFSFASAAQISFSAAVWLSMCQIVLLQR